DTYAGAAANGCDSIVTTDLTINELPNVGVTLVNETITADLTGANYQWVDCNDDFTAITGETSEEFTAAENGRYAVIIDDGNCVDTSICVEINTVNLKQFKKDFEIQIYPNPTKGPLFIQLENYGDTSFELSLVDALGKIIHNEVFSSEEVKLDLSALRKGVYFVRLNSNNQVKVYRVVKH
ncbi:hypothetical protein CW751_05585, partial [Brumimicrobium salinarum]